MVAAMATAYTDCSFPARIRTYTGPSVLVIDDVGITPFGRNQANAFFQVVNRRYENRWATIVTTNRGLPAWTELFGGDAVVAAAILDRLLDGAAVINIKGPSWRLREHQALTQPSPNSSKRPQPQADDGANVPHGTPQRTRLSMRRRHRGDDRLRFTRSGDPRPCRSTGSSKVYIIRSCGGGPTRSKAGPARSCATSSANRCSACRASLVSTRMWPGARCRATEPASRRLRPPHGRWSLDFYDTPGVEGATFRVTTMSCCPRWGESPLRPSQPP
jgi:hypothetical protein